MLYRSRTERVLCPETVMATLSYGTSENAVRTQIWIAINVYALVAIVMKRLSLQMSLYTISQILSVTLFEKTPILQALLTTACTDQKDDSWNQPNLLD
jgi:hypothetical protein